MRPTAALLLLALPLVAVADPIKLATSGYLLNGADQPLDNPTLGIKFRVYSHATSTSSLEWSSNSCSVAVAGGYYSTVLGDTCLGPVPLDNTHLPANATRWLELEIAGVTLSPRLVLNPAPASALAALAVNATSLGGAPATSYARLDQAAAFTQGVSATSLSATGDVTATSPGRFVGSGSGLTGVPAASLSGSIADAQLASGADLMKLSGAQTVAGVKTFSAQASLASGLTSAGNIVVTGSAKFVGDGSLLTNLPGGSGGGGGQLTWSPGALAFGNVTTTSSSQTSTLSNAGTTTITGLSITATQGFSLASTTCGSSLNAGSSCTATFQMSVAAPSGARQGAGVAFSSAGSPAVLLQGTYVPGDGTLPANAGASCADIKANFPSSLDGPYYIDPDGAGVGNAAFQVYCDMTTNGVGWTLCLSNVARGKGTLISDTNTWWTTTWDKGTRVFTRGNKNTGSAWGNFCLELVSRSTQIYATVYSEANAMTKGDVCTLASNFWTAGAGYVGLNCTGATRMAAIPKSTYSPNGCTNCIFWQDEVIPNTTATVWNHNFAGTHVMVKLGGQSAYGTGGIHWGYVNTGMSDPTNGGDVHCGSQGNWCYEAYTTGCSGSCDKWLKSMQLYVR